ncbi:MAG: hypothetical protein ACHBN1_19890 [Heteroscytonema crispum UTEX LB 1556]
MKKCLLAAAGRVSFLYLLAGLSPVQAMPAKEVASETLEFNLAEELSNFLQ